MMELCVEQTKQNETSDIPNVGPPPIPPPLLTRGDSRWLVAFGELHCEEGHYGVNIVVSLCNE